MFVRMLNPKLFTHLMQNKTTLQPKFKKLLLVFYQSHVHIVLQLKKKISVEALLKSSLKRCKTMTPLTLDSCQD